MTLEDINTICVNHGFKTEYEKYSGGCAIIVYTPFEDLTFVNAYSSSEYMWMAEKPFARQTVYVRGHTKLLNYATMSIEEFEKRVITYKQESDNAIKKIKMLQIQKAIDKDFA